MGQETSLNQVHDTQSKDQGISGIVLAGGASSRLGQNKALVKVAGISMIARVVKQLCSIVSETILVTNTPQQFAFLGLPMVRDIYPGIGTLGGLHAGLSSIRAPYGLAVGCDMPFLSRDLLQFMISLQNGYDIVMPRIGPHYEPLHAIYSRRCLPVIEQRIKAGKRRMLSISQGLHVRYVDEAEITTYDPHKLSFFNVNDPQDLIRMRSMLEKRKEN